MLPMTDGYVDLRDFPLSPYDGRDRPHAYNPGRGVFVFAADRIYGNTYCLGPTDLSLIGEQANILSVPLGFAGNPDCLVPDKRGARLMGLTVGPGFKMRNCPCNAVSAIVLRHGARVPRPTADVCDALPYFERAITEAMGYFAAHPCRRFTVWNARWARSKAAGFVWSGAFEAVRSGEGKAMIKSEVYHKVPTKARLIQFYKNYHTQSYFAPLCYSLQKSLTAVFQFHELAPGITATFGSGKNARDLATWMTQCLGYGASWWLERDGKNWDSTLGPRCTKFRRRFYRRFDRHFAKFIAAMNRSTRNTIVFRGLGRLIYVIRHTMKSGHNDTTLSNSLINIAIALMTMLTLGLRGHIIATGDDLLISGCGRAPTVDEWVRAERVYGILPEANVFFSPFRVSFVSGIFVSDGEVIAFVPILGRQLARLWWTVHDPQGYSSEYCTGVALGLLPTCRDIPIMRQLLLPYVTASRALKSDKGYMYRDADQPLGDGIWDFYASRYDIHVADLRSCDAFMSTLAPAPSYVSHPVLDRICEFDALPIERRPTTW